MSTIHLHQPAPPFTLPDQDGTMRSLSDYAGKYVLLYFYPKDDTPGCTTEACTFRDAMNDLEDTGVQVLGISADTAKSHKKFAQKYQLNFPLLVDTTRTVIDAYDVWRRKSMFGKRFMGIMRESFLIGPDGIVLKHYEHVQPEEHPAQVLADVQAFQHGD